VRIGSLAAALALAFGVPAAGAASWKQVTASGESNIDEVSLMRAGDGVLHVAWSSHPTPNTYDLFHTAISPAGTVGATSPIATGWAVIENPALVFDGTKLLAFVGAPGRRLPASRIKT
jgi:hypothetical protein